MRHVVKHQQGASILQLAVVSVVRLWKRANSKQGLRGERQGGGRVGRCSTATDSGEVFSCAKRLPLPRFLHHAAAGWYTLDAGLHPKDLPL